MGHVPSPPRPMPTGIGPLGQIGWKPPSSDPDGDAGMLWPIALICLFAVGVAFAACWPHPPSPVATVEPVGKVVSARVVPRAYGDYPISEIDTEAFHCVVVGKASVRIGAEAELVTKESGKQFLSVDGSPYMFAVDR